MKKSLAATLSIVLAIAVTGCSAAVDPSAQSGSSESSSEVSDSSETEESSIPSSESSDTTAKAAPTYEEQAKMILENSEIWISCMPETEATSYITFTDLDRDGNVELIVARSEDAELNTSFEFYEYYDINGSEGIKLVDRLTSDNNCPDIITDNLFVYYSDSEQHYAVNDVIIQSEFRKYDSKYILTYSDDIIDLQLLGTSVLTIDEGGEFTEYYDGRNKELTKTEFDNLYDTFANAVPGFTRTKIELQWFEAEGISPTDYDMISKTVAFF